MCGQVGARLLGPGCESSRPCPHPGSDAGLPEASPSDSRAPGPTFRLPTLENPHTVENKSHLFLFTLQGASEQGLEKIPEPIKEATALFYGKERLAK